MLYLNTRNRADSFTSHRVLHEQFAPDGGLFVPFRLPIMSDTEIRIILQKSFGDCVSHIINVFFGCELSGHDLNLLVGSHPARLNMMPHRIVIAELWHNAESDYSFVENHIYQRLCRDKTGVATDWAKIAIRISVLFGLFAELGRNGVHACDIAVPSGDFSLPIAAWYARKMGLKIGNIICGCNENSGTWDLIHRGELNLGSSVIHTHLPALDYAYPVSAERLIYETLGLNEAQRYADLCSKRSIYILDELALSKINDGISVAVVSSRRTDSVIMSLYRSNGYIADSYTAVAYAALQDYRASTGESRTTLLLSDSSPVLSDVRVAKNIGLSVEELRRKL